MSYIDEKTGRRKLRIKVDDEKALKNSKFSKKNKELIKSFIKREKEDITASSTIAKKIHHLEAIDNYWINKPFNKLSRKDIRKLYKDLHENKILTKKKKFYSEDSKTSYLKTFRRLMKFMFRRKLYYDKSVSYEESFGDLKYKRNDDDREPTIFSMEQLKQMCSLASPKMRIVIALGGDAGARPEEMWNIHRKHITWDKNRQVYDVYINSPKKNSKGRTCDSPYFTDIIKYYLASFDLKPDDYVVKLDEYHINRQLKVLAKKIGVEAPKDKNLRKKSLSIYSLRHSSIQNFYDLYGGNLIYMANRYGWSPKSTPQRLDGYMARSKVNLPDSGELANQPKVTEIETRLRIKEVEIEMLNKKLEAHDRLFERFLKKEEKLKEFPK